MSTKIDKICELAQAAVGKAKYPTSGSGTTSYAAILKGSPVDCSGFIVAVFKQVGITSYHGSNTLWRKYMTNKGSVSNHQSSNGYPKNNNALKSTQLKKGMLVYKWNSNTPSKFNDDLGDYQHVGIVTSVNPLHIVHSTSSNNGQGVTMDTKISTWCAWGVHKGLDIDNNDAAEQEKEDIPGGDTVSYTAYVNTSGGKLNVRKSAGGAVIAKLNNETPVTVLEQSGNWVYCTTGKITGWCAKAYIQMTEQDPEDQQDQQEEATETKKYTGQVAQLAEQVRLLKLRVSALQAMITKKKWFC